MGSRQVPFAVSEDIDPSAFLLLGDPNRESLGMLHRYMMPGAAAILFGLGSVLGNAIQKKPLRAGIHVHLLYALGGGIFGKIGDQKKDEWAAERDLQYFHYVSQHPEDFKAPERVLFRDYLGQWYPVR